MGGRGGRIPHNSVMTLQFNLSYPIIKSWTTHWQVLFNTKILVLDVSKTALGHLSLKIGQCVENVSCQALTALLWTTREYFTGNLFLKIKGFREFSELLDKFIWLKIGLFICNFQYCWIYCCFVFLYFASGKNMKG